MNKSEIFSLIQEVIQEELDEFAKRAPVGHPSNLHGSEESQRDWVMRAAAKNGWISAAWIAEELGIPRQMINHWGYIKRIGRDPSRAEQDFVKVVQDVPFQHGAIYQLLGTPPLSPEEIEQVMAREESLYKKTQGVYYAVFLSPNINQSMPLLGWLNLQKGEDPTPYKEMIPKDLRGDYVFSKKPLEKGPKETDTILNKDTWKEFVQTKLTEKKRV